MLQQLKGAYIDEQVACDQANRNAALAAKGKGYDSSPMGGFDKVKLVEALHIPSPRDGFSIVFDSIHNCLSE